MRGLITPQSVLLLATLAAIGSGRTLAQALPQQPALHDASRTDTSLKTGSPLPAALDGYEVFSSDGRKIGEVTRVNMRAGNVHGVNVRSPGYWGYFRKTYALPAEHLRLRRGRLDLILTSDQIAQFAK